MLKKTLSQMASFFLLQTWSFPFYPPPSNYTSPERDQQQVQDVVAGGLSHQPELDMPIWGPWFGVTVILVAVILKQQT